MGDRNETERVNQQQRADAEHGYGNCGRDNLTLPGERRFERDDRQPR